MLGYVHNLYKPVAERFKDYIAIPKANGYQSLHTTLFGPYGVPIEIQIRTRRMHDMAENGIAAHWLYKSDDDPSQHTEAQIRAHAWVQNLVEFENNSANSQEFIEDVKTDLFPNEVYVFTPKGEILPLPEGATPIDFAYAVHTDIGNTCIAAKVDRHYTVLSRPLLSGQTVEIICAPNAEPNPLWLDFAVTGKARGTIRHYFKRQRASESGQLGEALLNKVLSSANVTFDELSNAAVEQVLEAQQLKTVQDLLEKIGLGHLPAQAIGEALLNAAGGVATTASTAPQSIQSVAIRGTEGLVVNTGKCCYPIPGDNIVGRINAGSGLMVHLDTCSTLKSLHNEQLIPLRWETENDKHYPVEITVDVDNQPGVLSELTTVIAQNDCNIDDFSVRRTSEAHRSIVLLIMVSDLEQFNKLIRRLEKIKSVHRVQRGKSK